MATNDKRVKILDKKVLGLTELGTRFLDLLLKASRDVLVAVFPRRGLFTACAISSGGADKFTLSKLYGTDGSGKLALVQAADSLITAVPFENDNGVPYHVGALIAEAPDEVETNVRTGASQYPDLKEYVGWLGTPDSVVDNGNGTLTFQVDAVTEAGVSNAGRKVRVWKNTAASSVVGVAFEELTVAWAGGQNKITTAAKFGQSVASVVAADYTVLLLGPRVSRNTDLSAVAGVIYVGTVTGAGAGIAPSVFNTAAQYVYGDLQTLVDDVLEQDAHGKWRVCVKADGSDSKTPQISVKDSTGVRRFWLDEQGRFHHKDEPGAYNGVPFGGASAGSTATTQDNQLDALLGNVMQGLNRVADHERILGTVLENSILSGCEVTAAALLTVDIAGGTVLGAGRLIVQAAQSGFAVPDNSTFFIVWTGVAFDISVAYPPSSRALVARVVTAAGAVTSVIDMRLFPVDLDRQIDVNVGGPNAHFSTVYEAVRAINAMCRPGTGSPTRSWRILVRGATTEPGVIQFEVHGITIEGLPGSSGPNGAAAMVSWSGDQELFDLNGQADLTFRNLSLVYDDGAAIADATISRVAFNDSSGGGGPQRIHIENVLIRAVQATRLHGYLRSSGGSTFSDVWIKDCYWFGASEFGINLGAAQDFRVVDSYIASANTTQNGAGTGSVGGIALGGAGFGAIHIRGCRLEAWGNRGIKLTGCPGARVTNCDVHAGDVNGTTTKYVGIEIDATSSRCWIVNCQVWNIGNTAATAFGAQVAGARTVITGNDCKCAAGAAAKTGIDLTAASTYAMVDCNQTNNQGLVVAGGPHSIGGSNRDDV